MTYKKMNPEDFKVGRKYRTNHPEFSQFIYECVLEHPEFKWLGKCCIRPGGFAGLDGNITENYMWEEVIQKKKKFL